MINFPCHEGVSYYLGKYFETKGVLFKAQETFDDFENYLTIRHHFAKIALRLHRDFWRQ